MPAFLKAQDIFKKTQPTFLAGICTSNNHHLQELIKSFYLYTSDMMMREGIGFGQASFDYNKREKIDFNDLSNTLTDHLSCHRKNRDDSAFRRAGSRE